MPALLRVFAITSKEEYGKHGCSDVVAERWVKNHINRENKEQCVSNAVFDALLP